MRRLPAAPCCWQPAPHTGPAIDRPPDGLDGGGKAHIDGQQRKACCVRANSATIRGLVLTCSGDSHDRVDSAIVVEGHYNRIEDNRIEDVLFGITLHASKP